MKGVYDAVAGGKTVVIAGGELVYSSFEMRPDLRGIVTATFNEASELYDGGYGYR